MVIANRIVSIEAAPLPVEIDLSTAVVLVIDMQNDFCVEGGMFHRAGIDISATKRAIAPTRRVIAAARDAGLPIVYLKMAHLEDMSDAGSPASPHWRRHWRLSIGEAVTSPDGEPGRMLIDGTWNTEIVPELSPMPGDIVVRKHRYSGFFETDLDARLRAMDARTLIVMGCSTSVCVDSTLRDAMFRDYDALLLEDCTGQPDPAGAVFSRHEASLRIISGIFASISNSDEFIRAVG